MSLVPGELPIGDDVLRVGRAWPREIGVDSMHLRVEGRDTAGRLRAGEATFTVADSGWTVFATDVLPFATDRRLPALFDATSSGELVVHRSGRRAVVRRQDDYLKVVRPGALAGLVEATNVGGQLAGRAGWNAPTGTGEPGTVGAARLSVVPGEPLHELAARGASRTLTDAWEAFVDGWPQVVRADLQLRPHSAHDEAAIVDRWVGDAARVLTAVPGSDPTITAALDACAYRVRLDLLSVEGRPSAAAHRDLHDKQLLFGDAGLGVLDLDTAARAEVELDLANLTEHVRLRGQQGLWSRAVVEEGEAAVLRVLDRVGGDPDRFAAYRAATRLRLGCLYLFRPRWSRLACSMLADCAALDESSLIQVSSAGHEQRSDSMA